MSRVYSLYSYTNSLAISCNSHHLLYRHRTPYIRQLVQTSRARGAMMEAFENNAAALFQSPEPLPPTVTVGAIDKDGTFNYTKTFHTAAPNETHESKEPVYWIASMTKFLTCIAVLQCVERGQLELDGDVAKVLPELKDPRILLSHEEGQEPIYRPASRPITLRHLLTHTGGLSNWSSKFALLPKTKVRESKPVIHDDVLDAFHFQLVREPGTEFEYASGLDFAGKMVERVNPGHTLGSYLQAHVFTLLGIHDATFHLEQHPPAFRARIPPGYMRNADDPTGALLPFSRQTIIEDPITGDFGGGGLYTTASSLLKIYAAILRRDERILRPETLNALFTPQLPGDGRGGVPKGLDQYFDADNAYSRAMMGTIPPGSPINFGLGGLMPGVDVEGRRSKDSITWSGGTNCYWWIDAKKGVAGLYLSQLRPHGDKKTVELFTAFEDAVYRTVG